MYPNNFILKVKKMPYSNRTIIAKLQLKKMPLDEKCNILRHREEMLTSVSNYINNELNPIKCNIYDARDNYVQPLSAEEILKSLRVSQQDYYEALSKSDDNDFQN